MTKKLSEALKQDKEKLISDEIDDTSSVDDKNHQFDNYGTDSYHRPKISTTTRDKIGAVVTESLVNIKTYIEEQGHEIGEFLSYEDMERYIEYIVTYN